MTRGNRQGNNAFIDYDVEFNTHASMPSHEELSFFEEQWLFRNLTPQFYKTVSLTVLFKENFKFENKLHKVARTGNRNMLIFLIEPLLKHDNYGFNQLHMDALKLEKLEAKYAT